MALLTHCGGRAVDFAEVEVVETPEPTGAHYPLPHHLLVDTVRNCLTVGGFTIRDEAHALSHGGARYFGVINLGGAEDDPTSCDWVVGLRNSHDKKFSAGIAAGSRVMVCDNLSFTGEERVARKHTRFIGRDLPRKVSQTIGRLGKTFDITGQRYERYRKTPLPTRDTAVGDLMVRALDAGVIPASKIPRVLETWRNPPQPEWREQRNAWGLFNAFTEDFKTIRDPGTHIARGQALHGLMDSFTGFCPLAAGRN